MSKSKKILVFQHVAVEHPGFFRNLFKADGYDYLPIELDAGESIPSLDGFDALWVMGGPMDVWQEDDHPWLKQEKAVIREAVVDRQLPYFGFCLGHQLLADALGGTVGLAREAEVGLLRVTRIAAGRDNAFLQGIPNEIEVLQWHGAEVTRTPAGATVLASSPKCANQAMSVGKCALSIQFHIEVTADMVGSWNAIPEYHCALEENLGNGGASDLVAKMNQHMPVLNRYAQTLYANWKRCAGWLD